MPIYEYVCQSCEHTFEELVRSMANRRAKQCPSCGSTSVERKLSVFAAREGSTESSPGPGPGGPCAQCCNPDGICPL